MPDVVIALLLAAATAVIGLVVKRHWPAVERFLFQRKSVRATIESEAPLPMLAFESDPAVFEAGFPNWEGYGYVFPADLSAIGPPPTNLCREWREWARARGGVDATCTKVQVIVEGRNDGPIVIDRFEVELLAKREPLRGTHAACLVGGATASPRELVVNLDDDPPSTRFADPGGDPTTRFLFTLSPGEVETFRIYAVAADVDCEWIARLSYVAHGRRQFIEVSDEGDPFRTTGTRNATRYVWLEGKWSDAFFDE